MERATQLLIMCAYSMSSYGSFFGQKHVGKNDCYTCTYLSYSSYLKLYHFKLFSEESQMSYTVILERDGGPIVGRGLNQAQACWGWVYEVLNYFMLILIVHPFHRLDHYIPSTFLDFVFCRKRNLAFVMVFMHDNISFLSFQFTINKLLNNEKGRFRLALLDQQIDM